jgi:subtilisin family serine protease
MVKFIKVNILVLIYYVSIVAQSTYFIKYKDYVPKSEIEVKVQSDSFVPPNVDFTPGANLKAVDHIAKGIAKEDEVLGRIVKVTFTNDVDEISFLQLKNLDPSIEYIQKSNIYQIDLVPNDSLLSDQWALEKIKAFDAWEVTTGSDTVLLAIIDTGIEFFHPDLENKIYYNPGEMGMTAPGDPCWTGVPEDKRFNDCDDDGNGFIDDYMGWDFTDREGFPFDPSSGDHLDWDNYPYDSIPGNFGFHGTFVAGIAGAEFDNITGIAGVAPNIKLLNIRSFTNAGFGEEDDAAAAILYAVQMGAKVINMSWGDNSFSYVLRDVIRYAYAQNVVLVGSSGNTGSSNPHYPSGYSEVICVGNSTINDFVASNSNYGSTLDLVAPGTNILSTSMQGGYRTSGGTSAASPHVAATAALILSRQSFINEEVKQILKSNTDDIMDPGWDIKSGAGRLNMYQAVTTLAPSIIKFNHPLQDFATLDDELTINATILSPLFSYFNLYFGTGLNPTEWTNLISNGTNQFSNEEIYTLDLSSLPDTVYALRLEVQLTNGRTLEERVNFFISRTPPEAFVISAGPAFYGNRTTILAAIYTDEPSITRMYYRKLGDTEFRFITLDGFTINNQFVKYLHYGFIPKQLVNQNTLYEVYFEAENLVGLKTIITNEGQNFFFNTNFDAEISGETELPYSLPAGIIFKDPIAITSPDLNEVYLREFTNPRVSSLYKMTNNNFVFVDTLYERIVKNIDDFNDNGLTDLLTFWVYNSHILEQHAVNSSNFTEKFSSTTNDFWPIFAEDIDNDGLTELLVLSDERTIVAWNIQNDFSITLSDTLHNFTEPLFGLNMINFPNAAFADISGNGEKELWFLDLDGDIFSYRIVGPDNYEEGSVISTGFFGDGAHIAAGDYNGDGVDELAVLLHSVDFLDIAPFYRLIVFNLIGGTLNILYDQVLIDAATEFSSQFQGAENSIRFADINNDGFEELILFMFPYSYIFKDYGGSNKVISYKENINSNSIFVGDLNHNNVPEVGFPTATGISFYEFTVSNQTSTPFNLTGYSLDSSTVYLTWAGNVNQYYIYRGTSREDLVLVDSTITNEYFDFNLTKMYSIIMLFRLLILSGKYHSQIYPRYLLFIHIHRVKF